MKKSILYTCTALLLVVLFACEKDNDYGTLPTTISNSDYLPDNNANFWVYESYRIDSNGVETFLKRDTTTVFDSTANGKQYKFYKSEAAPIVFSRVPLGLRDSSGYMITQFGNIAFTVKSINTTLNVDTIVKTYIFSNKMTKESCQTLPAGTFCDVLNNRFKAEFHPNIPDSVKPYQYRYAHNMYAKNIGLIFTSTFYASDPSLTTYERRLVSYHIVK